MNIVMGLGKQRKIVILRAREGRKADRSSAAHSRILAVIPVDLAG
jgi:hypothetical protein